MRKLFVLVFALISITISGFFSINNNHSEKIVFEGFGNFTDMSYKGEIKDIIEEEEISELKLIIVGKTDFSFNIGIKEGLTDAEAEKIQAMRRNAGAAYYKDVNHILIWHGRNICTARNPKCNDCPLNKKCPKLDIPNIKMSF